MHGCVYTIKSFIIHLVSLLPKSSKVLASFSLFIYFSTNELIEISTLRGIFHEAKKEEEAEKEENNNTSNIYIYTCLTF